MAQTTGVIDGSLMRITIGGNNVAKAISCSMELTRATSDRIHKDLTTGQTEKKVNEFTGSVSGEAFYTFDGANNTFDVLFTAMQAGTQLACELTTANAGDVEYTFNGYLTDLSSSHEAQQDSTFSFTIAIDGAITKQTIT